MFPLKILHDVLNSVVKGDVLKNVFARIVDSTSVQSKSWLNIVGLLLLLILTPLMIQWKITQHLSAQKSVTSELQQIGSERHFELCKCRRWSESCWITWRQGWLEHSRHGSKYRNRSSINWWQDKWLKERWKMNSFVSILKLSVAS